jgi:hypothetical protein
MNGMQGQEHMAPLLAIGTQRSRQQISRKKGSTHEIIGLTRDAPDE